nr:MAG TPA: hypothetical protein [Caudoviricetes sp.]
MPECWNSYQAQPLHIVPPYSLLTKNHHMTVFLSSIHRKIHYSSKKNSFANHR